MTEPTREAQMRSDFEDWYLSVIGDRMPYDPKHGYYLDDAAQDMWLAWQARVPPGCVVVPVETAKDAERYRWLREQSDAQTLLCKGGDFFRHQPGMFDAPPLEELDAAIDAERAKEQP